MPRLSNLLLSLLVLTLIYQRPACGFYRPLPSLLEKALQKALDQELEKGQANKQNSEEVKETMEDTLSKRIQDQFARHQFQQAQSEQEQEHRNILQKIVFEQRHRFRHY